MHALRKIPFSQKYKFVESTVIKISITHWNDDYFRYHDGYRIIVRIGENDNGKNINRRDSILSGIYILYTKRNNFKVNPAFNHA